MLAVETIKQKALELGFDLVGITDATPISPDHVRHLQTWLQAGHAGSMTYMQRNLDKRTCPDKLLKGAQSVIVVGLNYKPAITERNGPAPGYGTVARYACYEDYHDFMKRRLFLLTEFIQLHSADTLGFKACVDSVPLAERSLALRAGLGFIGKNHMLIHPDWGQEIFLGELITTLSLPVDSPRQGSCGDCQRCLAACPTGALQANGQLNARKCINYLTIEHRGDIPAELARQIDARVYGCDTCVTVCPWQERAPVCRNSDFSHAPQREQLDLRACLRWDDVTFEERFGASPVQRIGLAQLQRNARICLDNLQD